jgi:hypothetical protein
LYHPKPFLKHGKIPENGAITYILRIKPEFYMPLVHMSKFVTKIETDHILFGKWLNFINGRSMMW